MTGRAAGDPVVLLIEDDDASRGATRELLALKGYRAVAFADMRRALRWCERASRAPALVVSDYLLPEDATGIDVIRAVREQFGEAIPAILVTGMTDADIADESREYRCALLRKPMSSRALLDRIADLVGEPPQPAP